MLAGARHEVEQHAGIQHRECTAVAAGKHVAGEGVCPGDGRRAFAGVFGGLLYVRLHLVEHDPLARLVAGYADITVRPVVCPVCGGAFHSSLHGRGGGKPAAERRQKVLPAALQAFGDDFQREACGAAQSDRTVRSCRTCFGKTHLSAENTACQKVRQRVKVIAHRLQLCRFFDDGLSVLMVKTDSFPGVFHDIRRLGDVGHLTVRQDGPCAPADMFCRNVSGSGQLAGDVNGVFLRRDADGQTTAAVGDVDDAVLDIQRLGKSLCSQRGGRDRQPHHADLYRAVQLGEGVGAVDVQTDVAVLLGPDACCTFAVAQRHGAAVGFAERVKGDIAVFDL